VRSRTGVGLDQAIVVVPPPITAAGWDSRWVIMKRGENKVYAFDLAYEKLFGPYDAKEFERTRQKLTLSPQLDFARNYAED
jgi:hypothetical protein